MPFRSVIGHRTILSLLARAIARGTLPPSLLFAGPAGVGKRRVALAVAEALNCPQAAAAGTLAVDACGQCSVCRRIARGLHPDVLLLEPADSGHIVIEPVREVIERAGYRPFEGRRRVVVIDEADALVPQAQNALLKTLEEPPSASVFVLVSSMPDALLATVRSRCPRLRFGALAPREIAEALVRDHGCAEAEARAAAADADGSLGRALSMRSAGAAEARDNARRALERAVQTVDPGERLAIARELTGRKGTPAEERDRLAACLRALASLVRDVGVLVASADDRLLTNADLRQPLASLARAFDARRAAQAYARIDRALAALERNANAKIVADWVVMGI